MDYVFGPVPSRRLGQSLGIDTIPLKTCNWNCVYCQLGRSEPLVNVRKSYFPREAILAEIKTALTQHADDDIDWLTFVGSGEPTLHRDIGWLIAKTKTLTSKPVAVITNGSLLYLPEVRQALLPADAVLPTLDAGTAELYRRINRPHPELTFERLVDGLIAFRKNYRGKLWVESMLIHGLNDSESALNDLAAVLSRIKPDAVHINLPTRPPVEDWVHPADDEALLKARAILGNIAEVVHPISGTFDLSGYNNVVDAIISIITRHPMRESELKRALSQWTAGDVDAALVALEKSGKAQTLQRYGVRFWSAAPAHYPDKSTRPPRQ